MNRILCTPSHISPFTQMRTNSFNMYTFNDPAFSVFVHDEITDILLKAAATYRKYDRLLEPITTRMLIRSHTDNAIQYFWKCLNWWFSVNLIHSNWSSLFLFAEITECHNIFILILSLWKIYIKCYLRRETYPSVSIYIWITAYQRYLCNR